ncbi:hypothetical protein GQ54DRAFT_310326, partial [Martensiomyces pterosporus]
MENSDISEDWPVSETVEDISRQLDYRTNVFLKDEKRQKLRFFISRFPNSYQISQAIVRNGGIRVNSTNADKADILFYIKHTRTSIQRDSAVCHPRFVIDSLRAGRMLDVERYRLKQPQETRKGRSEGLGDDSKSQKTGHTPPSSPINDIRLLYSDEDLDAEDRLVNSFLSSQSRSITEYEPRASGSPDSRSTQSIAISDTDARMKAFLDAHARAIPSARHVEDEPGDNPDARLEQSPGSIPRHPSHPAQKAMSSSSSVSPELLPSRGSPPGAVYGSSRKHAPPIVRARSAQHPRAVASTHQSPSREAASGSPAPRRVALISSASKSFIDARSKFESLLPTANGSQTSARGKSPSAAQRVRNIVNRRVSSSSSNRGPQQPSLPLLPISTQASGIGESLGFDDMESTQSIPSSPELTMPVSQAPAAREFDSAHSMEDSPEKRSPELAGRQSPPPLGITDGNSNRNGSTELPDLLLAEEYANPLRLFASQSAIPGKQSPMPEPNGKDSSNASARTTPDLTSGEPNRSGTSLSPGDNSHSSSVSPWEGLGKRRRTQDGRSEYDQRPLPVVVSHEEERRQAPVLDQSQPSQPAPAASEKSVELSTSTPTKRRTGKPKIRVLPFSTPKRIRLSGSESPLYKQMTPVSGETHGSPNSGLGSITNESLADVPGAGNAEASPPAAESPEVLAPQSSSFSETSPSSVLPSSLPTASPVLHVSQSPALTQSKAAGHDMLSDPTIPSPEPSPPPRSPQHSSRHSSPAMPSPQTQPTPIMKSDSDTETELLQDTDSAPVPVPVPTPAPAPASGSEPESGSDSDSDSEPDSDSAPDPDSASGPDSGSGPGSDPGPGSDSDSTSDSGSTSGSGSDSDSTSGSDSDSNYSSKSTDGGKEIEPDKLQAEQNILRRSP